MKTLTASLFFLTFCFLFPVTAQVFSIRHDSLVLLQGSSIRGMSVVDDSVAWISGSKGTVARTINGGRDWEKIDVPAKYNKRDFRSIEAFDEMRAYIINSGDSATLLFTGDGGASWKEIFTDTNRKAFFDATAWWDENNGIIAADPVNGIFNNTSFSIGKIDTISTDESGNVIKADSGEACFAASGTCLRIANGGLAWIMSGGSRCRLFYSNDYGKRWKYYDCPMIIQGKASQGAFSVAFKDSLYGVVVGGDYSNDKLREKNCAITFNGGKKWIKPKLAPHGYRSCVEHIQNKIFLCTGTSGTDVSYDGGITWKNIDTGSYNVCRKAKNGNLILIAGDKGRVGVVRVK